MSYSDLSSVGALAYKVESSVSYMIKPKANESVNIKHFVIDFVEFSFDNIHNIQVLTGGALESFTHPNAPGGFEGIIHAGSLRCKVRSHDFIAVNQYGLIAVVKKKGQNWLLPMTWDC